MAIDSPGGPQVAELPRLVDLLSWILGGACSQEVVFELCISLEEGCEFFIGDW
jgi:hypothetical protein